MLPFKVYLLGNFLKIFFSTDQAYILLIANSYLFLIQEHILKLCLIVFYLWWSLSLSLSLFSLSLSFSRMSVIFRFDHYSPYVGTQYKMELSEGNSECFWENSKKPRQESYDPSFFKSTELFLKGGFVAFPV